MTKKHAFKMGESHDWYAGCSKEEIEMYEQMRKDQQEAKKKGPSGEIALILDQVEKQAEEEN